ncbi:MAG TPA: glycine zipper family protein [Thermoanaerobaculia bacterium]|nr:glycine zipper family protein [Thermoanaerobaculia bacterium]
MKKILTTAAILAVLIPLSSGAQQKTLAATMDVHAFPKDGQSADVQSKDEAACYQWATQNTGVDPFHLQSQANQAAANQQATAQATQGSGARGAARGAAGGALIGAIAGDAGKGAAIGATAGFVGGRMRARGAQEQAAQQTAQTQQATGQQIDGFKKAFSACLEAKQYMVKY